MGRSGARRRSTIAESLEAVAPVNGKQRLRTLISRSSGGPYQGARFADRRAAGRILAARLGSYAGEPRLVVLGLPRGGVPVAFEVAAALQATLDVFLVRKLGVPGQEELAMGAIASGGTRVLNPTVIQRMGISEFDVESVARK